MIECQYCKATFSNKRNLAKHVKRFHVKSDIVYKCSECNKQFNDKEYYLQHVKYTHTIEKKYSCNLCDKTFKRKGELQRHTEYVHNKKYNFSCNKCDSVFTHQRLLDQHYQRIHTKNKPEKCKNCDMSFVTKSDVLRHAKSSHWTAEQRKNAKLTDWCSVCWLSRLCIGTIHWDLKMCDSCMIFKNLKRSRRYIQNYFLNLMKTHFQLSYPDVEYIPSTQDKQYIGGNACNTSKRQPDLGFVVGKLNNGRMRFINCEIDEEAHSTREESCELAKMDNTNQAVNNGNDEVIFLRIAIGYKDKKPLLQDKAKLLSERIYYWLNNVEATDCLYVNNYPAKVGVEYLYYTNTEGFKHVNASKVNDNIEVLALFE